MTNDKSAKFRWLFVWIGILTLCDRVIGQKRAPNYSQNDMPTTSFSCGDKIVGGYYADLETDCQMFHVCVHIPGVGIQNFRFLCPNNTLFDQEHQICDDWYNIDCQLSSLYGDNFDLYRIGANNEIKKATSTNKSTWIPLGPPSSTIKPPSWYTNKPKKNQYEDEDDYKRSGNDILRGSHSNNFYASENRVRDYADDNFDVYQQLNRTDAANEVKKPETLTRKLSGKRPITRKPVQRYYSDSRSFATIANPIFTSRQFSQNDRVATNAKKIAQSRKNDDVNFDSYGGGGAVIVSKTREENLQKATGIYRRINDLNEIDSENSSRVTTNPTVKTDENFDNLRQRTQKIPAKAVYTGSTTARTETVRLPSTDYLRIIAQTYQQPAIFINNRLQYGNGDDRRYKNERPNLTTKISLFSTYRAEYPQFSSTIGNYRQLVTTTKAYNYPKFIDDRLNSTSDIYGKYENYRSSTTNPYSSNIAVASSAIAGNVDQNRTFQTVTKKYDDEDESLKIAQSLNNYLKPSDINTSIYDGKKRLYVNGTLKAVYDVADQTLKSSSYNKQSINVDATASSNKYVISDSISKNYNQITQIRKSNSSMLVTAGSNSTTENSKNRDYDYAYYDNNNESSEYDQIDTVAEDFVKIEKIPNRRRKSEKIVN